MISPHPSYPPLEMSHLGLLVLTNRYDEKDLSRAHPNIASIEAMTVSGFAEGLAALCRRFEADPGAGDHARTHVPEFLDAGPERGVGAAFLLRRRPKLLLFLVAAVAVAVAVIAVVRSGGSPAGSPMTSPRAAGAGSRSASRSAATTPP